MSDQITRTLPALAATISVRTPLVLMVGIATLLGHLAAPQAAYGQPTAARSDAQPAVEKDTQVRLLRDERLYFKSDVHHIGKQGETFTVLAFRPGEQKVFVAFESSTGTIALSVAKDAVEPITPNPVVLGKGMAEAYSKNEFTKAAELAAKAAKAFPENKTFPGLVENLRALAEFSADAAKQKITTAGVTQKIALLRRNADVIDRPNRLVPSDNSAQVRAAEMRRQADAMQEAAKNAATETETRVVTIRSRVQQLLVDVEAAPVGEKSWKTAKDLGEMNRLMSEDSATRRKAELREQEEWLARRKKADEEMSSVFQKAQAKADLERANTPFVRLQAKYGAVDLAVSGVTEFDNTKFYRIGGGQGPIFYVSQVTDQYILAANVAGEREPWALLVFQNPKSLEGVQIPEKSFGKAVGRFDGFKTVEMVSGAERRFPVFVCTGFEFLPDKFVNTEKK